jgi:hypothetical protein
LKDISDSHIVQEKRNHVDHFTQGEEINIQGITLLAQKSTSFLEEEKNVAEVGVHCETIPSVDTIYSQLVTNVLKEVELPFKASPFENVFLFKRGFSFS